jgi:mannose PTS system EIIAB component
MVVMLRIDDRLIHGQVAFVWSKQLAINGIVVADDEVAKDSLQCTTLKMACPQGIKLAIKGVDDAIALVNNPKADGMKVLILVKNPKNALRIYEGAKGVNWINIGNYGRMNKDDDDKQPFTKEVYASKEDVEIFRRIAETGVKFQIQMVPADPAKSVSSLLKSAKEE